MQRPLIVSTFLVLFILLQACAAQDEQQAETGLTSIPLTAPMRTLEPTSPPATVMTTHMGTLEPTSPPATATTTLMPEATATATILPAVTATTAFTRTPLPREDKTEIPGVDSVIETMFPSPIPDAAALGAALPQSLYFLSTELRTPIGALQPQGVWRLDPGSTVVERITPPDLDITSFDIRPGNDLPTFGTRTRQIYTVSQDGQSNLLYDAKLSTLPGPAAGGRV